MENKFKIPKKTMTKIKHPATAFYKNKVFFINMNSNIISSLKCVVIHHLIIHLIHASASSTSANNPYKMKWGFASTAALVLAQQKDTFYANQLSEELKTVALDWLGKFEN
jgi:hypothetical protein